MQVNNFYQTLFEDTLGLDVLGLESQFPDLVKLVDRQTLVTFSELIPAKYLMYIDLSDTSRVVKKEQFTNGVEYYLDDETLDKYELPILDICSIQYSNVGNVDPYDPQSANYYNSVMACRNNISFEDVLMGSEHTYSTRMIESALPFKRYHELRGSKVLYLKNYTFNGMVELTIKTRWPNIISIPDEYREALLGLAKLDIKIKLWNELKYLEDVVTPSGNLSLKISDWDSAERDRVDYVRELKARSFSDRIGPSYFHIL